MESTDPRILRFVGSFGRFFEEAGASRSGGLVLSWLLVSEEPQSLDDIADALQISKASASLATRIWEQFGLIDRIHVPGERKIFYQFRPNIAESVARASLMKFQALTELFEQGVEVVGDDRPRAKAMLEEFARVYRHLNKRLPEILAELDEESSV